MLHDTSASAPCCVIPIERAEALVAELEEAAKLAAILGEALARERAQRERVYLALADLIGEEQARQIAEGERSGSPAPADALDSRPSSLGIVAVPSGEQVVLSVDL